MTVCIDLDIATVPYTFVGPNSTSRIDFFLFLASSTLSKSIACCGIMDEFLHSDHCPLLVCFDITIDYFECRERSFSIGFPGQIRRFISRIYFLCIQIRRFWHYGVNLLFYFTLLAFKSMFLSL